MVPKISLAFFAFLFSFTCLQAQDKNVNNEQFKTQLHQLQDKYELQKRTTDQSYESEIHTLNAQRGLTPQQKQIQRKVIQQKYHQQEETEKTAYEAQKKNLQAQRKNYVRLPKEPKEAKEPKKIKEPKEVKDPKPMKPIKSHPLKSPKPMKH